MTDHLDRRRILQGVAVVGGGAVAGSVLAACGSDDGNGGDSGSSGSSTSGGGESTSDGAASSSGTVLGSTSEVPVGGGIVFEDEKVVVAQPTEGDFRAYSAVCTHQGCIVSLIEDTTMTCPCHNSEFSTEDGSVLGGPATEPLPAVTVTTDGDDLVLE